MSRVTIRFAREVSSVPSGGMQSFATAPSRSRGSTPPRMAAGLDGGVEQGLQDRPEMLLEVGGKGLEGRVSEVQRGRPPRKVRRISPGACPGMVSSG